MAYFPNPTIIDIYDISNGQIHQTPNLQLPISILNPFQMPFSARPNWSYHNGHGPRGPRSFRGNMLRGNRATTGFRWKPKGSIKEEPNSISSNSISPNPNYPISRSQSSPSTECDVDCKCIRCLRSNPSAQVFEQEHLEPVPREVPRPGHFQDNFQGIPIRIVYDNKRCQHAIRDLMRTDPSFVGFDCEWAQSYGRPRGREQRKISLIQIATENMIILIRIKAIASKRAIPPNLLSFLRSRAIIKCGVGIEGDAKKLRNDYGIELNGYVDLNNVLVREYGARDQQITDYQMIGLKRMAQMILQREMPWKKKVNHKKWESRKLSPKQIQYACDDALVAYLIFQRLRSTQYHGMSVQQMTQQHLDQPFLSDIRVMTTSTRDAMDRQQRAS